MGLPRITYNSVNIDFDRCLNRYEHSNNAVIQRANAVNGKIETLYFSNSEALEIEKQRMSGTIEAQLEKFWNYARSGQSFSFWFDRDLGGYWDFEGSGLSNDRNDITVTRATTANYTNPSTGLVTSVATNTARYETGKYGLGILSENAATNILTYSEQFDNAAWTKTDCSITDDNTTHVLDPAGGNTSDLLEPSAATGTIAQDTATNISTDSAVFSIYLMTAEDAVQAATLYIYRVDTGATLASQAISIAHSWQRFSVAYASAGSITANWGVKIEFNTSGQNYYLWGAQLEVGAAISHASSYIQTTAAAVTRNVDVISASTSGVLPDMARTGSVCFWYSPKFSSTTNAQGRHLLYITAASVATYLLEIYIDTSQVLTAELNMLDSDIISCTGTIAYTAGTFYHIAVTWDLTGTNSLKLYFNGSLLETSTNSLWVPVRTGSAIYIGGSGGSTSCSGIIDDLEIRKDVLSAAEISYRYNKGYALGWRRNYFSSLVLNQDEYSPRLLQGAYRHDVPLKFLEQK